VGTGETRVSVGVSVGVSVRGVSVMAGVVTGVAVFRLGVIAISVEGGVSVGKDIAVHDGVGLPGLIAGALPVLRLPVKIQVAPITTKIITAHPINIGRKNRFSTSGFPVGPPISAGKGATVLRAKTGQRKCCFPLIQNKR
jgi:hypothetical protein